MYIVDLFDNDLNLISTPVINVEIDLKEKVFDFDEIRLKGEIVETGQVNIIKTYATIFRLSDGSKDYFGFIKKTIIKDKTIEIIGRDLREVFDTDIIIDYITSPVNHFLDDLLESIANKFRNAVDVVAHKIPITINVEPSSTLTNPPFGEFENQIFTTNAYDYLLPFLKYYGYMIKKTVNLNSKEIVFNITSSRNVYDIKVIEDFFPDFKESEPNVNKAIAIQNFPEFGYEWKKQEYVEVLQDTGETQWTIEPKDPPFYELIEETTEYEWKYQENLNSHLDPYDPSPFNQCSEGYIYSEDAAGNKYCTPIEDWVDVYPYQYQMSPNKPSAPSGYRWIKTGTEQTLYHYKILEYVMKWVDIEPLETQFAQTEPEETDPDLRWVQTGNTQAPTGTIKHYYLSTGNNIVESDQYGDFVGRYYPVKTKIFSNEYLAQAQFEAIMELLNNRYLTNIYINLNNPLLPIDISDVRVGDRLRWSEGILDTMPVSEKHLKVTTKGEEKKIKLGFKKDRFTNIVAIK